MGGRGEVRRGRVRCEGRVCQRVYQRVYQRVCQRACCVVVPMVAHGKRHKQGVSEGVRTVLC